MNIKDMKEVAKDILIDALSVAYYQLEDKNYSEEEVDIICKYIHQYGEAMCKRIGKNFFTQ